jgi:hypothetical protein
MSPLIRRVLDNDKLPPGEAVTPGFEKVTKRRFPWQPRQAPIMASSPDLPSPQPVQPATPTDANNSGDNSQQWWDANETLLPGPTITSTPRRQNKPEGAIARSPSTDRNLDDDPTSPIPPNLPSPLQPTKVKLPARSAVKPFLLKSLKLPTEHFPTQASAADPNQQASTAKRESRRMASHKATKKLHANRKQYY